MYNHCAATVLKETSDMPIMNGGRHSKPCKNKFYIIVRFKQATCNISLCNNVTSHAIHDILNLGVKNSTKDPRVRKKKHPVQNTDRIIHTLFVSFCDTSGIFCCVSA